MVTVPTPGERRAGRRHGSHCVKGLLRDGERQSMQAAAWGIGCLCGGRTPGCAQVGAELRISSGLPWGSGASLAPQPPVLKWKRSLNPHPEAG